MANIKQEKQLIDDFILSGKLKGKFITNVKVGISLVPEYHKEVVKKYQGVSKILQKEIDLVCENDEIWLLEAKPRANTSAIGQLLTYKYLYIKEKGVQEKRIRLGLICRYRDEILQPVFREYGITLFFIK